MRIRRVYLHIHPRYIRVCVCVNKLLILWIVSIYYYTHTHVCEIPLRAIGQSPSERVSPRKRLHSYIYTSEKKRSPFQI